MGVPIDSIFYVGFYIGSALLPHTYNRFQNFGKKNFFLRHKNTTKKYFLLQRICNEKSFYLWWVGGFNYFLYIFVRNKPMI